MRSETTTLSTAKKNAGESSQSPFLKQSHFLLLLLL
jgi:hypothetical protein